MNNQSLDTTIEVNGKKISINDLLKIDEGDLPTELASQAARFAYFAVIASAARKEWLDTTRLRKEQEAEAFAYVREDKDAEIFGTYGKITDGLANQLVDLDENVSEARKTENEAEYRCRMLQAVADAFSMRATMITQLSADARREMGIMGMGASQPPSEKLKISIDAKKHAHSIGRTK